MSSPERTRTAARSPRAAGLLLHPSSLPGPFPIGDLGPSAVAMLDWMVRAGFSVWQVLPLGPTGMGDSPYNALSAFAGNPLLVSPELLLRDGLLVEDDLAPWRANSGSQVDFASAVACKDGLLRTAFRRFEAARDGETHRALADFANPARSAAWLDDWALYAALKREQGGKAWIDWPTALRRRDPAALAKARVEHDSEIQFATFCQFLFFRQWRELRAAAEQRLVRILGDVPIYVAPDSADTWANRRLFDLDDDGRPRAVAGVPPDYFSADGQRWGNPLYRWDLMRQEGFAWWIARIASQLEFAHLLRLDHFRGFAAFWKIPARDSTARRGRWVKGPGEGLLVALRSALGGLPLLAEDLGEIDAKVHALRRKFDLPGMRVLQFGFASADSDHAPHRHETRAVAYTGTHDNDTSRGWFARAGEEERARTLCYLGATPETISFSMIRAAYGSVADLAIVPLQDALDLGSEARMNTPGRSSGNWSWRVRHADVPEDLPSRLRALAAATARLPSACEWT